MSSMLHHMYPSYAIFSAVLTWSVRFPHCCFDLPLVTDGSSYKLRCTSCSPLCLPYPRRLLRRLPSPSANLFHVRHVCTNMALYFLYLSYPYLQFASNFVSFCSNVVIRLQGLMDTVTVRWTSYFRISVAIEPPNDYRSLFCMFLQDRSCLAFSLGFQPFAILEFPSQNGRFQGGFVTLLRLSITSLSRSRLSKRAAFWSIFFCRFAVVAAVCTFSTFIHRKPLSFDTSIIVAGHYHYPIFLL